MGRIGRWSVAILVLGATSLASCIAQVPAPAGGSAGIPSASAPPTPRATPASTDAPSALPTRTASTRPSPDPALARMIGQKLVVRMEGTTPSPALLGRIRRGEVGGVILFGANIRSDAQVIALTSALHGAAADAGQPPLLIAVDQEGGAIKRIPWAPPTESPPDIGRDGRTAVARAQGRATGKALRALGIDVDLAPVADIPTSDASFMARAGRTFSADADTTARLAAAFADGLESEGVLPAMKHFPGIGSATADTDGNVVTVTASVTDLDAALAPYRTAIAGGIPLIMLSNAAYPAYDADAAAGWSSAIVRDLLRDGLGFDGATITDSLEGTSHARGVSVTSIATRAAVAGTDLLLLTGSEGATRRVYADLLHAAEAGAIPSSALHDSDDRIRELKTLLVSGDPPPA